MTQSYDITIKKPISFWKRELSFSFQDIFIPLGKAAVSFAVGDGKGIAKNTIGAIKGIAFKDTPAEAAWGLIFKSLCQSLLDLTKDYKEFFSEKIDEDKIKELTITLEKDLDSIEAGLDADFFDNPHQLQLLEDIKPALIRWLAGLGMEEFQAEALHLRLKSYFGLSLHKEWLKNPSEYECIKTAVTSPFVKAKKSERGWMQYREWLQEKANERVFAEAFSLQQVYVPLRGYYEKREDNHLFIKRIVIDLHKEMKSWLTNFNADNALKVICGGPGSGKSSFAKIFAADISREKKEITVIFIPIYHFDPSIGVFEALSQFIKEDRFLYANSLNEKKERLLLIFDGLDELAMQGKAAAEKAELFIEKVQKEINQSNDQKFQCQAIITGRDIAVQSASSFLHQEKQILHLLPYYIPDDEKIKYTDDNNLLETDQREQWWQNYGNAKKLSYDGLPNTLNINKLTPITSEPLLNYLIAIAYESGVRFSNKSSINDIYKKLLEAVHKRQWDHGTHKSVQHMDIEQFSHVLEEIAICVWHGDGRTTTVGHISKQLEKIKLDRFFEAFQQGAEKGVFRLLTAFYFRQSGIIQENEETFEFTHKSFGEYLTAKRIIKEVKSLHNGLKQYHENPYAGINESTALERWAEICGPTAIDTYLFQFLRDEVTLHKEEVSDWQKTFASLLGIAIRNGMPMEKTGLSNFKEMMRQSRNAEEALMLIYNVCAIQTQKIIKIDCGEDKTAFGEWLKRMQGQRKKDLMNNFILLEHLDFLDISDYTFPCADFYGANLLKTNLEGADLTRANLEGANLTGANLTGANLKGANLKGADLIGTKLTGAKLTGAKLTEANLTGADLIGTKLTGADLRGTKLTGAKLTGADLIGTKLTRADLRGTKLTGADLTGTKLTGANLEGADLTEAVLIGADLIEAVLTGADLTGADLTVADLTEAVLSEAVLTEANLTRAKLTIAKLTGANLERANLEGADLTRTDLTRAKLDNSYLKNTLLDE